MGGGWEGGGGKGVISYELMTTFLRYYFINSFSIIFFSLSIKPFSSLCLCVFIVKCLIYADRSYLHNDMYFFKCFIENREHLRRQIPVCIIFLPNICFRIHNHLLIYLFTILCYVLNLVSLMWC